MFCISFQQSWSDKLVERIRNVIKRDRLKCGHNDCLKCGHDYRLKCGHDYRLKCGHDYRLKCGHDDDDQSPVEKLPKKANSWYPVSTATNNSTEVTEDAESLSEHIESIKKEMQKERPRDSLLAQLMRSTYQYRQDQIITESIPVSKILECFEATCYGMSIVLLYYVILVIHIDRARDVPHYE